MQKNIKRAFCILTTSMCILGSATNAWAIEFDVTYPGDQYSYTVKKEDSEQSFYLTGTYFSHTGTLSGYSYQVNNNNVKSYTASISSSNPRAVKSYIRYAAPNLEYELYTWANINGMNVRGRYTP